MILKTLSLEENLKFIGKIIKLFLEHLQMFKVLFYSFVLNINTINKSL